MIRTQENAKRTRQSIGPLIGNRPWSLLPALLRASESVRAANNELFK